MWLKVLFGSADVWNNELDRIAFFHKNYGTSVEEMEAASVAQIASQYKSTIPWCFVFLIEQYYQRGRI